MLCARMVRSSLAFLASLALALPSHASAAPVVDGAARFEVITPSLVRVEIAEDRRFEDGRTQTTAGRLPVRTTRFTTSVRRRELVIRTARMTLRWRRGSTTVDGVRVKLGRRTLRPGPGPNPAPLGGWRRSLDLVNG